MKKSKYLKPSERQVLHVHVVATKQLSPNFLRVTLGGEALHQFRPVGFDQWFRLFLPNEQGAFHPPTRSDGLWLAQYMLKSKGTRPTGRNYTVRQFRTDGVHSSGPELDIDFALHTDTHGHSGPATRWAMNAIPGDPAAILDEGITYQPTPEAQWQLLVGDETGLPAIMRILGDAPRDLRMEVFLEIPHPDDAQDVDAPATIHWLPRTESDPNALDALRTATLPVAPGYAFVAGGNTLATTVRRHLVNDRGFSKESVTFTGYWR